MISFKEKLILGGLFLIFIIPESIWGVVRNQLYSLYCANFSQYDSVSDLLSSPSPRSFIVLIVYIQLVAIILTFIFLVIKRKKINNNKMFLFLIILSGILALLTFVVCLIVFAKTHVTPRFP
jgi:hypothetical protein